MKTTWISKRALFLVCVVLLSCAAAAGQDLGTSNKLFEKKEPAAKKTQAPPTKPKARHSTKAVTSRKRIRKPVRKSASAVKIPVRIAPRTGAKTVKETVPKPAATEKVSDSSFDRLIADADSARDARSYASAENTYKRALAARPADTRAAMGLGSLYINTLRWVDAEKAYRAALKINPRNATANVALSYVLAQPVASPDLSDRYDEAEKLARRAIELGGSNALTYDQLGVSLERRGLIGSETESAYRRAISIEPSFAPAYAHLGRLLLRVGRDQEAGEITAQALSRARDVPAMIFVAEVMQSEQRFGDSIPLIRRALEIDPQNPSALVLAGRAYLATGNFTDAEPLLTRAARVSPASFAPYSLLGRMFQRKGSLDAAETALLQAMQVADTFEKRELAEQFDSLGGDFSRAGRRDAAARSFSRAKTLDDTRRGVAKKGGSRR